MVAPSSLSREFHAQLFRDLEDNTINGGNNIMAGVPDLMRVYTDPAILGAARSLVGPGCDLHSHRHAHKTIGNPENAPTPGVLPPGSWVSTQAIMIGPIKRWNILDIF